MVTLELSFGAEVVEQQTLLNGTRYLSIEGESLAGEAQANGGAWSLSLNVALPKEAGAPLEEGDLILAGPNGALDAGLESGETAMVMDDPGEDEQERLSLSLSILGGEGAFVGARGEVRLRGVLVGGSGRLDVTLSVDTAPDRVE